MIRSKKRIITIIFLLASFIVFAQKSAVYEYGDNDYLKGLELYEKQKYGAARKVFDKYLEEHPGSKSEIRSEASFYRAMSAVELRNDDAEFLVHSFVSEFPGSPYVDEAAFRLADYFYDKNNWAKGISWYNRVDRFKIGKEKLPEYYFKKGYCFYERNDYENARVNFYEILEVESSYQGPATYYYAHIHYVDGNYETSLWGFRRIDDDPLFQDIAPYYISQILYLQQKYDEVIVYAPPLMNSVSEGRLGEMAKIIGESHFMLQQYKEAIPYLETYSSNTDSYTIHDRYQLAYSYYRNQEYENALKLFEQISYRNTEIAQSALYTLGDCYLKTGDKKKALIAFSKAANMDFDPKIQQDALFNFAKVTFELSYNPFNDAIRALELYIRSYPAADNVDEAYNYLVTAYLGTRNYSMAMSSLEKIRRKDANIERATQKVAFYRGLELYKNLRFAEAVDALEVSLQYAKYDRVIASRTYFWLGEAAYRTGDRSTARMYYDEFLKDERAPQQEEYSLVHYSLGYFYFDNETYGESLNWFSKFLRLEQGKSAPNISDAYNRMADCYFVQTDYIRAIEYYNRCIQSGKADLDYAMFQKGFTLGLLDRTLEKVEVLNQLITQQPQSTFVDDALFEIGRSYVVVNQPDKAVAYYKRVVNEHSNSSYTNNALNQLGLIHYNASEYDEALTYYERVATDYPGTPEADNALTSIKNIYVRKDNVDGYMAFVNSLGRDITRSEQDSLSYTAAEMVYMRNNCEGTVRAFKDYLDAFPMGRFLLNAHYYKADCQLKLGQNSEALESLSFIIAQPRNMFTVPALEAASKISFREKDYHRAADYYRAMLEVAEQKVHIFDAHVGLMRCYYELGEYSNTIEAARQLLQLDKIQEEYNREANYKIARSFHEMNEVDFAYDFYEKVAHEVNSKEGAESKYMMIEILHERGELDQAEKAVYDFIDMNTPHQYWMGMAFLSLSDVYMEKGDEFSAINTLQTLITNYHIPDEGIIDNARQRKSAMTEQAESDIAPDSEPVQ
ncbi:MAG: tetratricopeptide repeat protein [Bacteroidia bacterium]|nr:MAG: tetratricopeptide repeat protein [Bacteroidia bacterium]